MKLFVKQCQRDSLDMKTLTVELGMRAPVGKKIASHRDLP